MFYLPPYYVIFHVTAAGSRLVPIILIVARVGTSLEIPSIYSVNYALLE